jgi:hypothetical protein
MAPSDINASIVVGRKPGVEIEAQALNAIPATLTFAPWSVNVYEFPVN